MLRILFRKNAFRAWLMTVVLACLFVTPAYVFISHNQTPENVQIEVTASSFIHHKDQTNYPTEQIPVIKHHKNALFNPSKSTVKNATISDDNSQVSLLLSELVLEYQSSELTPDQKQHVRSILPEINASSEGRILIASLFFHPHDPIIAASMYDMILDANLKDPVLISELIKHSETELNPEFKVRLIDLIADHNTIPQEHKQEIQDFLADMALDSNENVKQAADSQWAWYVNKHKGILPVLDAYLFNHSAQVREEIFELIELNSIQNESERSEVALALESLKYADYLALSEQEKARIDTLKSGLRY